MKATLLICFLLATMISGANRPFVPTGRVLTKLRILTHNVYGLSKADCSRRAKTFGTKVAKASPRYDIVGVQEYYDTPDADIGTCDADHLSNAIWSTGRYKNGNNYYRFYPEVSWGFDGGVGIFTMHPIKKFDDWRWDNDSQGTFKAKEGFIFARIEIPFTPVTVDTYVVHLNSGGENRSRRKKQLQQLAKKIEALSSKSGNPVIVMGDFNIGGPPSDHGNDGYEDIMEILKNPLDLWMWSNGTDNGFTFDCVDNNVAKLSNCRGRERIDYIFVLANPKFTNSKYFARVTKTEVVKWKNATDNRSGSTNTNRYNVSDHYGVEATIELRD